jgi:L-asparaginase
MKPPPADEALAPLPRISLIGTGGTITMTPGRAGVVPTLSAQDVIDAVPALARHARIDALSYSMKPGASLSLEDLVTIAALIDARLEAGASGAVVTQGTDTIEETAFVLDLLVQSSAPVVVTGAMRAASAVGADGPANLLSSVVVASSAAAAGLGTLVVLNDEIHAARYVRKCHSTQPSAFDSPGVGTLGLVLEEQAVLHWRLPRAAPMPRPESLHDCPVALVALTLGDNGRVLEALSQLGYRGAVLEALGAGHVPAALVPPLQALSQQMPVILSTRVVAGPVLSRTYGFAGSESDLLERGLISAGWLSPGKAVQLLRLLLALGSSRRELESRFAHYGRASVPARRG